MLNFAYENPTKVIFGSDALEKLGKEVLSFGRKVLLVYGGSSLKATGGYEKITHALEAAQIEWLDFGGNRKPEIQSVAKAVTICKTQHIDVVIGIGGGCCMDLAKAIGRFARYEKSVSECLEDEAIIAARESLPVITIPTNPSSGSDYDPWCELVDSGAGKAYSLMNAWPAVAVLCPELSYSLNARQTAYGGATALIQLMSSYVARVENASLPTAMLEGMVKTLISSIRKAIANPTDYNARSNIMWCAASITGGAAGCGKYIEWSSSPLAGMLERVAGLGYQQAMCIVYPSWLAEVYDANIPLFCQMAVNVWGLSPDGKTEEELAWMAVQKMTDFWKEIGIAESVKEYTGHQFALADFEPLIQKIHEIDGMKLLEEEAMRRILSGCL